MPSLTVGVDEFTVILQPIDKATILEWPEVAEQIIATFLQKSKLVEMFGKMEYATKVQAGYTSGLTYSNRPWYLVVSWNEDMPNMGICVRFSAYAYAVYKAEFEQHFHTTMNIAVFLQSVQADIYTTRLSRIDMFADYKDYSDEIHQSEPLSPEKIYTRLKDGTYVVCNQKGRQSVRSISAIDRDGVCGTFYVGARAGKSNGFLRCYDKKSEQIQAMGYRYDEAIQCVSWVRFEAVFLHDFAHQISEELLKNSMTTQDLQRLIAQYISTRYCFVNVTSGEATKFSDDLVGIAIGTNAAALNTISPRDNTLRQSIEYLRTGSGLYATLFKAFKLWGDRADEQLLKYLYDDYAYLYKAKLQTGHDKSKMREIRAWLQRHETETKKHPLDDYLDRSKHKKYIPQYDAAGSPVVITMDGDDL